MAQKYTRILLTGAAGDLGTFLRPHLRKHCDVLRISDIAQLDNQNDAALDEIQLCPLEDLEGMKTLLSDVEAVVHMGAASEYATANSMSALLNPNIIGVYNVFEASRIAGVKRIVFASSHHVVGRYRHNDIVGTADSPRPDSLYAVAKLFGENLGRLYFDRYGIETVCLRIGSCFPEPKDIRMLSTWCSYDDVYRAIAASLETPHVDFSVLYGVSRNKQLYWSNAQATHIGFHPEDTAEDWREKIENTIGTEPQNFSSPWQGGTFGD